ncbi:MAG: 2-oxo acid dehydrogenase subunit E2 [Clostridia bacterium]|nr:2-oxo acid dehydrogenase subunit E2 [Oscillospiraceae bacterium]MBO4931591.1 2-oxo acid dehydrogenase subunit E2 [Clostridia bacterium]MBP3293222.1 2-oxo acid dehydrogenase subunit E2 [Clostridia bacterium]
MANIVIMPRQGQSVESCIITTWQKKKGDRVETGDILFSYETDKSAFDEPSQFSGTILELLAAEGDVVPCLDPVCIIGEEGEDISALIPGSAKEEAPAAEEAKAEEVVETKAVEAEATVSEADGARVFISPRAKNLALKTGVDMTKVVPTGPHGRIIERDINKALDAGFVATTSLVEDFLAGKPVVVEEAAPAVEEVKEAPVAAAPADDFRAYTDEPMSNIRKVIAKSMHASLSEMAQLTLNASFDATNLLAYRAKLKANGEALGLSKITINDMILFAAARVLPNYPEINANLIDNTFRKYKHANIGMAVDTDRGLLVPVIFGSDTLTLAELSAQAKTLAGKAREGKLSPDEMSGGSFTISNLGSMGIESFTPVINPPQTAILGVCCTTNRLKDDGKVYPAMGLSLTFDHRAVDGAPAAKFLKELCTALENFDLLLAK